MTAVLLVVAAYVIGSLSPSVILGRVVRGIDLRQHGSGNAGATNAFRVLGVRLGLAVLALDVAKGFLPVIVARQMEGPVVVVVVAMAAIAGHTWSLFLRGRGGKGVATGAGVLLAMMPWTALLLVLLFCVVLLTGSVVSAASLVAACALPILVLADGKPVPYVVFSFAAVAVVVYAHRGNIRRLLRRKEPRSGLSWRSAVLWVRGSIAGAGRRGADTTDGVDPRSDGGSPGGRE